MTVSFCAVDRLLIPFDTILGVVVVARICEQLLAIVNNNYILKIELAHSVLVVPLHYAALARLKEILPAAVVGCIAANGLCSKMFSRLSVNQ